MENAADALKMAGAVLIFVLAISVAILSFGKVRETADIIMSYRDRETVYIDGKMYYNPVDENGITQKVLNREVGLETAIPTITRAYLENYKVVFVGLNYPIYKIKANDGTLTSKYVLDLETNNNVNKYKNVVLATDEIKSEFLCGILYGTYKDKDGKETNNSNYFKYKFNITLDGCDTIYNQLKGKKLKEYLGVYYEKDEINNPDANKTEKRIITYEVVK